MLPPALKLSNAPSGPSHLTEGAAILNGSPAWSLFYLYPHVNLEHGDIRDTGPIVLSMLWPPSGQVENWMNSKVPLLMASLFLGKGLELTNNSKIQKEPTPAMKALQSWKILALL